LEITLDQKNATEAQIKIKVIESDYQSKVEEKVKDYSRKASIKGFRPGKVPMGLVRKMYGKSILIDEINQILAQSVTNYIRDNKLRIIGEPLPDSHEAEKIDWDTQKDFEFNYSIGLIDEFKVDLSKKQKVTGYSIEVDKKMIEETIDRLTTDFGDKSNPETSEADDILIGEMAQVGGDYLNEYVTLEVKKVEKKEQKHFIGKQVGDTVEFELHKAIKDMSVIARALNISQTEAKELKGNFKLSIKELERSVPATFDQEFFDKVFGKDVVKSKDEFEAKIKETLEQNYKNETEQFLSQSIQKQLVDSTKINTPDTFLKRWLLSTGDQKLTPEVIEKEFDMYLQELKWNLIKSHITEEFKLEVSSEEVLQEAKAMILSQFGGMSAAGALADKMDAIAENYLSGGEGENYSRVHNQVMNKKIMDFVKSSITISDKKVSMDEFVKVISN
jgi:trigger factor